MAQWVKNPTSAQVMISWFMSLSPALGSLLSAQTLLHILSSPLYPSPVCSSSLKNKHKKTPLPWPQSVAYYTLHKERERERERERDLSEQNFLT